MEVLSLPFRRALAILGSSALVGAAGACVVGGDPGALDEVPAGSGVVIHVDDLGDGAVGSGQPDDPYRDLQVAIDRAPDGAELRIAAGEYRARAAAYRDPTCGNCDAAEFARGASTTVGFTIRDKALHLRGAGPATRLVTQAGYGLLFERARDSSVHDLAVTGGTRAGSDGYATCGGIVVRSTSLSVVAAHVVGNRVSGADNYPGVAGIVCREGAALTVRASLIADNSWDGVALYRGVPGHPGTSCRATVTDSTIGCTDPARCDRHGTVEGAGIGVTWDAQLTAVGNTVHHHWKGILVFGSAQVVLHNNTVRDNLGWGILGADEATVYASNNVVLQNGTAGLSALGPRLRGGYRNNVVVGNGWEPDEWVGYWTGAWLSASPDQFFFRNNLIFGNHHRDFCVGDECRPAGYHGLDGNLNLDPRWNPSTFRPGAGSPLVDQGDPELRDVDRSRSDIGLYGGSDARGVSRFLLQTGTALPPIGASFAFLVGDVNRDGRADLLAINRSGNGSTEVHILDGAAGFGRFLLQTGTALHPTDATWDFLLADHDGDGHLDLHAVKKSATGTGTTEVHVLDGAAGFGRFLLQTGTALHPTDATFAFAVGDLNGDGHPDLYAVKKSGTGTGTTEVHVLDGAARFGRFLLQTGTALHPTDATFAFAVGAWNRDAWPDLFAVKKQNTGSGTTEVHVLTP